MSWQEEEDAIKEKEDDEDDVDDEKAAEWSNGVALRDTWTRW